MRSARRNKSQRTSASSRKSPRPFVSATFAMTVDGKITTRDFSPVNFTSREDKLHLFRQRALADAVLVGHTTLQRDNVRLGLPSELQKLRIKRGQTRSPLRVIVSNEGKIDNQLKIFRSDPATAGPVIIFSTRRMLKKFQTALRKKAILHLSKSEHVDLAGMLRTLRDESYDCPLSFWRSWCANIDRLEQEIPARKRPLHLDWHARHRRRMFPDLSH